MENRIALMPNLLENGASTSLQDKPLPPTISIELRKPFHGFLENKPSKVFNSLKKI
jgi:hypothetical protein